MPLFKGMLPARSDRGWKSALSATGFEQPCRIPAGCLRNMAKSFHSVQAPPYFEYPAVSSAIRVERRPAQ